MMMMIIIIVMKMRIIIKTSNKRGQLEPSQVIQKIPQQHKLERTKSRNY
jgi:hypothetical protein